MIIPERYQCCAEPMIGGMSAVAIYFDNVLERKVAIKRMLSLADQGRIKDEIKALLKLRSKHVVQIYDLICDRNELAIVQEFIDGKDLFDNSNRPRSELEYLKLLWQITSGIADIHSEEIIHRDIKPNNMKIDSEGVLKIFDFGLSRESGLEAVTKRFVGAEGFAAPELYASYPRFTKAVDVYAFAVTAVFLLQGSMPEALSSPVFPVKIDDIFAKYKLSDALVAIISRCLCLLPSDRPNIIEVRDLLAKHLLRNKHKALVVYDNKANYLSAENPEIHLHLSAVGGLKIYYDGFNFLVREVEGEVFLNNIRVLAGAPLPGACVVALGDRIRGPQRKYITFDLSHPEMVL